MSTVAASVNVCALGGRSSHCVEGGAVSKVANEGVDEERGGGSSAL